MRKQNFLKLKEQLKGIQEIEDTYGPLLQSGEQPEIDGVSYEEALLGQCDALVSVLEEVLQNEEDIPD